MAWQSLVGGLGDIIACAVDLPWVSAEDGSTAMSVAVRIKRIRQLGAAHRLGAPASVAQALRGIALGRKSWLFCGSDRSGERAAAMYSLIYLGQDERCRSAGLAGRRPNPDRHIPAHWLDELLPWNWTPKASAMRRDLGPPNKVHHVHTVARVAEMLGHDEHGLWDVANEMDQEDGLIWVYDLGDGKRQPVAADIVRALGAPLGYFVACQGSRASILLMG
jgi:hypothetical protein